MKKVEALELFMSINNALSLNKKVDFDARMCLIKNKARLKPLVEEYIEVRKAIQEEMQEISIEFCKKDNEGKPVTVTSSRGDATYVGLERGMNPEYDEKVKELNERMKAEGESSIEFDPQPMSEDQLKKLNNHEDVNGLILEQFYTHLVKG